MQLRFFSWNPDGRIQSRLSMPFPVFYPAVCSGNKPQGLKKQLQDSKDTQPVQNLSDEKQPLP